MRTLIGLGLMLVLGTSLAGTAVVCTPNAGCQVVVIVDGN